ncbi:MAG: hypothetical protein WDK96_03060 [Candidatus Paceibacterota bacterium]
MKEKENDQSKKEGKKNESRVEKYDPVPGGFHRNRMGYIDPDYEKGPLRYRRDYPDTRPARYRS